MMDRGAARLAALALSFAALAGCTTPVYAPISAENGGLGYHNTRHEDGTYTVLVRARSPAQAHEYWDRRAGELCDGAPYEKNIFRAEIPVVTQSGYATGANGYGGAYTQDVYGALVMEGYLRCSAAPQPATPEAPPPAPTGVPPTSP
jgi:hypothetical protein